MGPGWHKMGPNASALLSYLSPGMSPTNHFLSPGAGNPSLTHTPSIPHLLTHSQPTCPVILGLCHHLVFAQLASGKRALEHSPYY